MNVIKEIQRINERELEMGVAGTTTSWHDEYKDSAWVYIGGFTKEFSEGDLICVMSQVSQLLTFYLRGRGAS